MPENCLTMMVKVRHVPYVCGQRTVMIADSLSHTLNLLTMRYGLVLWRFNELRRSDWQRTSRSHVQSVLTGVKFILSSMSMARCGLKGIGKDLAIGLSAGPSGVFSLSPKRLNIPLYDEESARAPQSQGQLCSCCAGRVDLKRGH